MKSRRVNRWIGFILTTSLILWQTPAYALFDANPQEDSQSGVEGEAGLEIPQAGRELPQINAEVSGESAEPDFAPGQIIVKLKEGASFSDIEPLNRQFGVTGASELFPKRSSPQERLEALKGQRAGLETKEHKRWYWWADRGSGEVKDYEARLEQEKEALDRRIEAQGALIARLERRQARAPEGTTPPVLEGMYLLKTAESADVPAMVEVYAQNPAVEFAQPDYKYELQWVPNDPYYHSSGSWGQSYDDLWGLKRDKLNTEAAWDLTKGEGVIVAVLDTGVDYNHEDLAANIWVNAGEIPGNGVDDDGNGYMDDVRGYDFSDGDSDPADYHGHGTHCSGTIAAVGNNGLGVIGVAPRASIMPVKIFPLAYTSNVVSAIHYAADNGADVLSNSWGPPDKRPSDPAIEEAVRYAYGRGCVVVFAAGNKNDDVMFYSPANMPQTLTVSAMDDRDQRASFSNWGARIDVGAPGLEILSLRAGGTGYGSDPGVSGGNYARSKGTSMACPHVSGVAALVLARHPDFSVEQVRQAIRAGSDDVGEEGFDSDSGYGRLDAFGAINQEAPLEALLTSPSGIISGTKMTSVTGRAAGPGFSRWELDYIHNVFWGVWIRLASGTRPVEGETFLDWDLSEVTDGSYTLRLLVYNGLGEAFEDRATVKIDQVVLTDPQPGTFSILRGGERLSISGLVNPAHFQSYRILIKRSDGTELEDAAITLTNGGQSPVIYDLLGSWDTTGVPADHYQIVLAVTRTDGFVSKLARVIVDPTLHEGWPVYLGGSAGGFPPFLMDHLTAADINGDGLAELLVGFGDSVRIFDHKGQMLPGWPQPIDSTFPNSFIYSGPAVGDLDGDGHPEIVVTFIKPYSTFVWDASGQLLPGWPRLSVGHVAIDDINGDGIQEIIGVVDTLVSALKVNVVDVTGSSLPGWPRDLNRGSDPGPSLPSVSVAVGDVDGDGQKEIVVVDWAFPSVLYLLRSDGTTMPGWPQAIEPDTSIRSVFDGYSIPVLGDIDGDGDLEILVGSGDGQLYAFHHDGSHAAGWPQRGISNLGSFNAPVIGDLDGDGVPEVVAGQVGIHSISAGRFANYLFAWHGDGTSLPGWPVRAVFASPYVSIGGFQTPILVDLNGDGQVEVMASNDIYSRSPFALHAYQLDGSELEGFPKPTASLGAGPTNSPAAADLDGDGLLELAWIDFNYLYVWDLEAPASSLQPWPMFRHDPQRTGRYPHPHDHDVNHPPLLDPIGNKEVREGEELSFRVTATDPDGDPILLTVESLPAGSLFENPTGDFSWTPNFDQASTYSVTFSADDLIAPPRSETITITVHNVNRPPVIRFIRRSPSGTVEPNQLVFFYASAYDPDGRTSLTYKWYFPDGTVTGPRLRVFHRYRSIGVYSGILIVTDREGASTSGRYRVKVAEVNHPPLLDPIGDKEVKEGEELSFRVTATDPDGDRIFFRADPLPEGATIDGDSGYFSWTPDFEQSGTYSVTFSAYDFIMPPPSETITITVHDVNQPPVIRSIRHWPRSVEPNRPVIFYTYAYDPDGRTSLTYRWDFGDGRRITGPWRWVFHRYRRGGIYRGTLTVTDRNGASTSRRFTIRVGWRR